MRMKTSKTCSARCGTPVQSICGRELTARSSVLRAQETRISAKISSGTRQLLRPPHDRPSV